VLSLAFNLRTADSRGVDGSDRLRVSGRLFGPVCALKPLLIVVITAMAALTGGHRLAFGQTASTLAPQKNWKDRPEYDLWESIGKETVPAKRLELLNTWKEKYPNSDFADRRQQLFMTTYAELGRGGDALATAGDILARDPNNLRALSEALTAIFTLQNPPPSADQLTIAERAANQVLSNVDLLFAPDRKPAQVTETDWLAAKRNIRMVARNALGYVAWQRKDFEKAEGEFTRSLQVESDQGQVSYWLSNVILSEKKPEKYSAALFDMARAAAYDGPGSLNASGRQQVLGVFQKTYATWHGSDEGADEVLALARNTALPPPNFTIASKADLLKAKMQKEEELRKTNPQLALWRSLKETLTGPQAQSYFEEHMKGAEVPGGDIAEFCGKLIEAKPESRPKQLMISVDGGDAADAVLELAEPLSGKMEPGAKIGFKGIATAYAANPFSITFEVARKDVSGWKGNPGAGVSKPKRPARRSK
jgi:tetratricopeptide (TPR) repeat protein